MLKYNFELIKNLIKKENMSIAILYKQWSGAILFTYTHLTEGECQYYIIIDENADLNLLEQLVVKLLKSFNKLVFLDTNFSFRQMQFISDIILYNTNNIDTLKLVYVQNSYNGKLSKIFLPKVSFLKLKTVEININKINKTLKSQENNFRELMEKTIINPNIEYLVIKLPINAIEWKQKFEYNLKVQVYIFGYFSQSIFDYLKSCIESIIENPNSKNSVILPSSPQSLQTIILSQSFNEANIDEVRAQYIKRQSGILQNCASKGS